MSRLSAELLITAGVEGLPHLDRLVDRIEAAGGETGQLRDAAEALRREWDSLSTKEQESRLRDLADAANRGAQDVGLLGRRAREAADDLDAISRAKITLGLDNDAKIRQQIEEVREAYRLLQEDGGLSQQELARAAELHRQRIDELEAELGNLPPTLADVAQGIAKMVGATAGITAVVKDAVEFEQAMAGVKKVVDGTDAQIQALAGEIKNLAVELGVVPEAVAAIAAQGGQLGVAFADLPDFTRLAGQMSVAFGMTAEQSAEAAAKISNVFGITLGEMRALGDAINVLGNNTAAKEAEITEAMLRIGGTSKQFGLAAEQTAALADAFIALGKSPEVAGTAINALLTKLQTAPAQGKEFQAALESLGITAGQLAENIRNNPERAIVDFMARLEQMDKQSRAITLTELFGAEYADDISLAAGSLDTLRKAFGLVADKTQTAGAMQREFEAAMSTTGAKIEQAKIAIGNLATSLGAQLLPVIGTVAEGVGNAAQAISEFVEAHPRIAQAAAYLAAVKVAAIGVEGAMDAMGISTESVTTSAVKAFTAFRDAVSSGTGAIGGLRAAMSALSGVAITAAITAAIALYQELGSSVDEVRAAQDKAMQTWVKAEAAQSRINMALSEGVSAQSEYVREQQALLKAELTAIDQRISGYQEQIKAAQDKWVADNETIIAAQRAIAMEDERRASIEQTVAATDKLIKAAEKEAQAQAQAAQNKALAAEGWEKLTSRIADTDKALLQIPPRSQQIIEGLRAIAQSGAESGETLALAFRSAINQVETAEALDAIKTQLMDLAKAGEISKDTFDGLSASITARFAELPPAIGESAIALHALGLEAGQVQSGISKTAQEAIGHFAVAAREFGKDSESMSRIFTAALRKMGSAEEITALQQALQKVGDEAGFTADDIKAIGDAAPQAANKVAAAFAKIGVDVDAINQGISASARRAFDDFAEASAAAKEAGVSNAKLIQGAFENITSGLKTKEEFAAFNATLRETGQISQLTAQQQAALRAGMEGGAAAVAALAAQMQGANEAKRQSKDIVEANTEAIEKNTEALEKNAQAAGADAEENRKYAEAKKESVRHTLSFYDATNLSADAVAHLKERQRELLPVLAEALRGSMAAADGVRRISDEMQAYADAMRAGQDAADRLNALTDAGTVSLHDIAEAARAAQGGMFALDGTTLANLNAAIDAARQKLADMKQEAEDTRASLEAQLASLKGDDSKAQALDEERRLRELNLKLQEAEAKGQRAVADEYRRAIELQKQVFAEERRQQQQRQAEDTRRREENARRQNNSTGNSTNNTTSRSNTTGISATEVADAWDARIAAAEKRGAENFARELYNQAKRQAR